MQKNISRGKFCIPYTQYAIIVKILKHLPNSMSIEHYTVYMFCLPIIEIQNLFASNYMLILNFISCFLIFGLNLYATLI